MTPETEPDNKIRRLPLRRPSPGGVRRFAIALIAMLLSLGLVAPGAVHADPGDPGEPIPTPGGGGLQLPSIPGLPSLTLPNIGGIIPGSGGSGTSQQPTTTTPAAPSTTQAPSAGTTTSTSTAGAVDVSEDVCAKQQPEPGLRPTAGASPTAPPPTVKQLIPGSDNFGLDNILRTGAKIGGLDKELPAGEIFQGIRVFDPTIQGGGKYNSKTSLQSGLACSVVDSLLKRKVRRDTAQKLALAVVSIPTLLAGVEGPDVARAATNSSACAIAIAQAAAQAAISGGASSGAGAAAAAPAAISAAPPCVAAAGAIAVIVGKMMNIYEHNPAFPQLIEFSEILNPDSPIGSEVYNSTIAKLPILGQSGELRGLFKALSRFMLKMSEIWVGKSIAIFGNAVADAAAGKTNSVPAAVVAAIELGIQFFSAIMYTLTGSDTFTIAGETMLDTKQLSKQMSAVATGQLIRLPDEGSEVVAGGGLTGQGGTSQTLVQANLGCLMGQGTGPSGLSTQTANGYNQQAAVQQAINQSVVNQQVTQSGVQGIQSLQTVAQQQTVQPTIQQQTQTQGGQQVLPPAAQGPVMIQQQLPTSKQCTNQLPFQLDKTKALSQADYDQLKSLGLQPPKDPKKAPDGALFGLDANDPSSLLGKIPFLGSKGTGFNLPGIDLPGIPSLTGAGTGGGR